MLTISTAGSLGQSLCEKRSTQNAIFKNEVLILSNVNSLLTHCSEIHPLLPAQLLGHHGSQLGPKNSKGCKTGV